MSNLCKIAETNFDNSFQEFITIIYKVIEKYAPFKQMSRKQHQLKIKLWIIRGILTSIRCIETK